MDGVSQDPFLQHGCRKFESMGALVFSTKLTGSDSAGCKVEAGKTYYLHVMAADPTQGLAPNEHSCREGLSSTQNGCDVGIVSQPSYY